MSPRLPLCLLQTQSDARLVSAAREGHERAFEALVLRYRRPLLLYCRRLLLPEARAEDALQQGLLQAWLALRRGSEVREARAWLYRIVHNAAVDALRTSGYDHEQLRDSLRGATAPQSDIERRIAVRQALAGLSALPEMQREALLRNAIYGHSYEQVAAAMGVTDGAVRGLIYRGRTALRAAATAITPPPVVAWVADAGRRSAPLAQRLEGVGASGGTAAAGALVKGGAAVLTAGALLAGAATVQHPAPRPARPDGRAPIAYPRAVTNRGAAIMDLSTHASPSSAGRWISGGPGTARDGRQAGYRLPLTVVEDRGKEVRPTPGAVPLAASSSPEQTANGGSAKGAEARAVIGAASHSGKASEAPAAPPSGGSAGTDDSEGAGPAPSPGGNPGSGEAEPGDSSGLGSEPDDGAGSGAGGATGTGSAPESASTGPTGPAGWPSGESDRSPTLAPGPPGGSAATAQPGD